MNLHHVIIGCLALLPVAVSSATFDEVQSQIFNTSCALSGCHGNIQNPILTAGQSFMNIVDVASTQSSLDYVEPGDPDNSYIIRKVEGTGFGARMPFGRPALSSGQIQLLKDWIAAGASSGVYLGRAYLMTTSISNNVTFLHLINSSADSQSFTGTLYNGDGDRLGEADVPLHSGNIASQGRVILGSADLETLFDTSAWIGPAMLEVTGSAEFDLMTKLTSPSGLISNTNCVRSDQVHNVEGMDSANRTFVRFINVSELPIGPIIGSLQDENGDVIGQADSELIAQLAPKQAVFLNRDAIAEIVGSDWNGTASLTISDAPDSLRLLNLNFVNNETFFNFSCFENSARGGRIYLVTNSNSANISETHLINTSSENLEFRGTLYSGSGSRLGEAGSLLHDGVVSPGGRVILSAIELEARTGADAWSGPALVELDNAQDFELMTRLTSPSGLISNTNCVRSNNVQNIEGFDSENRTFVRFINQGESDITNITATLYDINGAVLGQPGVLMIERLMPKEARWLNREDLSELTGASWEGEASLQLSATAGDDLKLLNLNFVNNETFFNFSCYEAGYEVLPTEGGFDIVIPGPGYGY